MQSAFWERKKKKKLEHCKHETAIHLYDQRMELGALPPTPHSDLFLVFLHMMSYLQRMQVNISGTHRVELFNHANCE